MSTFYMMRNDSLSHHGVKGMKWGVRKDRATGSLKQRLQKKKADNIERKRKKAMDYHTSGKYTYKQRKHLTDKELQARVDRLQMEKKLKDLSKEDSKSFVTMSTGMREARKALGYYGAKVALEAVLPGAGKFVKNPNK